jgi:hypothetical protein
MQWEFYCQQEREYASKLIEDIKISGDKVVSNYKRGVKSLDKAIKLMEKLINKIKVQPS